MASWVCDELGGGELGGGEMYRTPDVLVRQGLMELLTHSIRLMSSEGYTKAM